MGAKAKSKNTMWTSANIVTIIRMLFVPVFVIALISPWPSWMDSSGSLDFIKPWVALVIFVVLSLTDSVDGYLARSRNEITNFGKFMDPLADKILVFAALIAFVELHVLPSWVVLVILIREFIVAGVRMLAASRGMVIAASWYGKAKTVTQLVAIIMFILKEALASSGAQSIASPLYIAAWAVMIISLILTVVSMIDYLWNAREVFKDENAEDSAELSQQIIDKAKNLNLSIGTAESLTAGLIAADLAKISGASDVFAGGIVSYMYHVKQKLLNVDEKHLKKYGAVNESTAKKMAIGGREKLDCDFCVSATGIAGPNKDEFGTEVGTVFIACASKNDCVCSELKLKGGRQEIREQSAQKALDLLYRNLK